MAFSIEDSAKVVLNLLDKYKVCIDIEERDNLNKSGDAEIYGFRCKIVNVLSLHSCRILVNTSWFSPKSPDYSKPHMIRGHNNPGIDYQLIPTREKLFAVHFLDLRQYALFLENNKEYWFNKSRWGMQLNEAKNSFVWEDGNTISFPLLRVTKASVFKERDKTILQTMLRQ